MEQDNDLPERRLRNRDAMTFFKRFAVGFIILIMFTNYNVMRFSDAVENTESIVEQATGDEAKAAADGIVFILLKEACRTQALVRDHNILARTAEIQAQECATTRLAELKKAGQK